MFGQVANRLRGLDENLKYRDASVKCSLNQLYKTKRDKKELKPLMREDAAVVSEAIYLFQRHLELEIIANRHNQDYFTDLLTTRSLRQKFLAFCNTTNLKLANCTVLKINQINHYEVCFRQNIRKNIRKWLQLFYRFVAHPEMTEAAAKTHVSRLFSGVLVEDRWSVLVDDRELNLVDMRKKQFMYHMIPHLLWISDQIRELHMLYREQLEDIPRGLKFFNVVAQKKAGTQYVRYDGSAIIQLLNKRAKQVNARIKMLKLKRPLMKILPNGADPRAAFEAAFNVRKFEKSDRKGVKTRFALQISTNGTIASIGLNRREDVKEVSQ